MTEDVIQAQLIAARRAQILEAAIKVFASKGYHRATIPDIAKEAGIAVGTIYNYFGKKEELLLALMHRLNESEQRDQDFAQSTEMDLRAFMKAYIAQRLTLLSGEGQQVLQTLLSEMLVNKDLAQMYMEQVVEPTYNVAEQYVGHLATELNVDPETIPLMLRLQAGVVLGVLILRILGDKEINERWDELPDLLVSFILGGLGGKS